MIHPFTESFSRPDCVGRGVRATSKLQKGELVWVRDALDTLWAPSQIADLTPTLRDEVDRLGCQRMSGDVLLRWDDAKYINHSCAPNLRGLGANALIAIGHIAQGEEILCDYAEHNTFTPMVCSCGTRSCRRRIGGLEPTVERLLDWERWQVEVQDAVDCAPREQPLLQVAADESLPLILEREIPVPNLFETCTGHP